jgi:hypothetical protein
MHSLWKPVPHPTIRTSLVRIFSTLKVNGVQNHSFLPLVLYGCETWSPTLREEHRLGVLANRVLRRICGSKRDEIIGGWRKLNNEEHHNLYSSLNIIRMIKSRRMGWTEHVAHMGGKRNAYRVLMEKKEGKRTRTIWF